MLRGRGIVGFDMFIRALGFKMLSVYMTHNYGGNFAIVSVGRRNTRNFSASFATQESMIRPSPIHVRIGSIDSVISCDV